MKKNTPAKIPVLDLSFSAFQHLHKNTPELSLQGTRVVFLFEATDTFYRLSELYNCNGSVRVLDYVNAIRQLRAMMMAMKGQNR